ncbi:cation diffusion facilitator family transporter [Salinicola lusitanus]|uniref:Cation diffusion facilitator family transporter n=1 Tax=Salinicola lusitanus TaxID=1949085 RepID=A0ABZ3CPT8_9GAMM
MATGQPVTESGALRLSMAVAAFIGIMALVISALSGSQAILLDGLFNAIYAVVGLFTLRVGRMALSPDDDTYPFGYGYFESMVNACKGLLMLGVSALALFNAVTALLTGGNAIAAGISIVYAGVATASCVATAFALKRISRHVSSPLLEADIENWRVNALISAAVLLAFCLIPLAQALGWYAIVPYVDSWLVIAVVLLCLGVPIRVARRAILELLNRSPQPAIAEPVRAALTSTLAPLPTEAIYIRMVRPGRLLYVTVHVVLEPGHPLSIAEADRWRAALDTCVRRISTPVLVEALFTGDRRWAAPSAGGDPVEAAATGPEGGAERDDGR